MQSYIGVLARSRVPLVDKKWAEIPKDIKEQIWEAVDMAFVIREKLEYNHRLSRKGYAGLEDQLEETMPGVEIDRSTLWKRARQDKHGNIPDPKVAEKAKLIKNEGNQDEEKNEEKKDEQKEEEKKFEEKEEEKKDEEKKEEKQDEKEKEQKEDEEKHDDKVIEGVDYSNMEVPSSLKSLCRYAETTLVPQEKIMNFTIDKEVFGVDRNTFVLPDDITQFAGMEEIGATMVAVYMRQGHKAPIWKTLSGTPKQPSSVECGYYVMRFMRDIIMDPSLAFEKKYAKGKEEAPYPQEAIDEVRNE
ncbi:unnamed protein product, partial [Prunus brigantina]